MAKGPIKDEELYTELRKQGNSKEKSARISNAAAASSRSAVGKRGGRRGRSHAIVRVNGLDCAMPGRRG